MSEFALVQRKYHDVYPFISPTANLKDAAKDKHILVTGAGSGIGKAIAKAFAQAGASTVVLVGRRRGKLDVVKNDIEQEFKDCQALVIPTDVSNPKSVDALFEELSKQGVVVNILINNAGVHLNEQKIVDSNVDQWWKDYEIMLRGPYLCARGFLRALNGQPGAIVNVSSISSNTTFPNQSSYGVIKSALNRLTEFMHAENAQQGVQSIAYHPGSIPDTGITSGLPDWIIQRFFTETAELAAGAALYLSTEKASYLSGRYVDALWDLEELEGFKDRILEEDLLKTTLIGDIRVKFDLTPPEGEKFDLTRSQGQK